MSDSLAWELIDAFARIYEKDDKHAFAVMREAITVTDRQELETCVLELLCAAMGAFESAARRGGTSLLEAAGEVVRRDA